MPAANDRAGPFRVIADAAGSRLYHHQDGHGEGQGNADSGD